MIRINVITSHLSWKRYIKNPISFIDRKMKFFNKRNKKFKKKTIFCTLMLSNNMEIKKLNQKFRKKNKATDVLSFPFYKKKELENKLKKEKEIYLGDIIINLDKIHDKVNIKNFYLEFDKLWVHGFVHLFGHDHKRDKDFKKMQRVEKKYLNYLS
jgi:probable rRNA maturation factor